MILDKHNPKELINNSTYSKELKAIATKVFNDERISFEEGVLLYKEAELGFLGTLANYVREKKNGNYVYFNHNFHVEPTNVCVYSCSFCSYSRLIKNRDQGWELSIEQIMDIIKKYDDKAVTEVHITGGVVPKQDLAFYTDLFREIKKHRPDLHIKALTPVEFHYIFKKAKLSYEDGLKLMTEAGLDSLPGGGAEIFDEAIRDKIAGGKCSTDEWLSIHEIWHNMGKYSNATMLYGHIETFEHRIDHMDRLRKLQDKTNGFNAFIPLKFRNKENEMSHVPEVSVIEDLRNYAISRIYLDNFPHIKAYWAMIGRNTAQLSLNFGTDDLDGTIDDTTKIYSMAGSEEQNPKLTTQELVDLIKTVGRTPVERDTLYNVVKEFAS
ncbi:MAG: aminofutalosine synthase MqnE [Bacteroidota bacterium]|nr:aminofutalosine synthase MqnE [Bacteroidota bacterium]MDP3146093.1 aminofutalosine synthase MqnE [Bacteroidota bacterium]MDP3558629.1 aminofutalosine synthase MqnE [Bacteroidota bacterium]